MRNELGKGSGSSDELRIQTREDAEQENVAKSDQGTVTDVTQKTCY
jgi:hypothetical protein